MADAIGTSADVVAAIVTYHDGTQLVTQYAPYTLERERRDAAGRA